MKFVIFFAMIATTTSAFALHTPLQQSAAITQVILEAISQDQGLSFHSLSKISLNSNAAKVELRDRNGNCMALALSITADAFGEPRAELMKDALAICD